jgi:hypothetical protein
MWEGLLCGLGAMDDPEAMLLNTFLTDNHDPGVSLQMLCVLCVLCFLSFFFLGSLTDLPFSLLYSEYILALPLWPTLLAYHISKFVRTVNSI